MRYYIAAFVVTTVFILPWFAVNYPVPLANFADLIGEKVNQIASVIVHNPKTVAGLQSTYNVAVPKGLAKVRILIVPGHEPDYGGAEYGSLKERDMNVELSKYLMQMLENDGHYQVFTTRDEKDWVPAFKDYFANHWNDIKAWQKAHKRDFAELVRVGQISQGTPSVFHTDAPEDVAFRLYGIDKWSNENDIDIMIHVHLNDYPRANKNTAGKYTGFAIYIPDSSYYNSSTTNSLAADIFERLKKYNAVSNFAGEKSGIVPDQDLIAVGSYNSVNAASMLIEYGYIYEQQFTNPEVRAVALKDLAYQTYLGLQDFFDPTNSTKLANVYDTLLLPYKWQGPIDEAKISSSTEIYVLQTALANKGLYPPPQNSKNDCPRTGKIGPCTKSSIMRFQKERNIKGEDGKIGPKTLDALNREFGTRPL